MNRTLTRFPRLTRRARWRQMRLALVNERLAHPPPLPRRRYLLTSDYGHESDAEPRCTWLADVSFWDFCKSVAWRLWKPFTICRIAGVPVQFHSTCLIYPGGALLLTGWIGHGGRDFPIMAGLLLVLWLSLLVHEFAHILTARRCGIGTDRVVVLPVGAVAMMNAMPRMAQEFWIALAGPFSSLALAGVFQLAAWALSHWLDALPLGLHALPHGYLHHRLWSDVLTLSRYSAWLNVCIAVFNLLPCFPMDGGRILRSLLAVALSKFTRRSRADAVLAATRIAVRWVAWPLALGALALTITHTQAWMHLVMFPLLLAGAELEYRLLRADKPPGDRSG